MIFPMERGKKRLERLRKRRQKAVALFEQGERQAAVAVHLRASRQSVSEWWQAWRRGDTQTLNGATRAYSEHRVSFPSGEPMLAEIQNVVTTSPDFSVRRERRVISSGCESRPATVAPAGST